MPLLDSPFLHRIAIAALFIGSAVGPAMAEDEDSSRAVTIIEAPTPGSPAPTTAPPAAKPSAPSEPGATALAPDRPAAGAPPSPLTSTPGGQAALGDPTVAADLLQRLAGVKVANSAELTVEILPGPEIAVGTKVSFRITTKKQGYLVLVDVDAGGKVTQIYPNPLSLLKAPSARQSSNLIKPGKPVIIPNPADPYAGFEFVAAPPHGTAMVAALLSDRAVQMIDLPDVPPAVAGQAPALAYLSTVTRELRIPSGEPGRLQEARWSLDAKFYAIR
jgi:Domain of unknown function (DUF4384)